MASSAVEVARSARARRLRTVETCQAPPLGGRDTPGVQHSRNGTVAPRAGAPDLLHDRQRVGREPVGFDRLPPASDGARRSNVGTRGPSLHTKASTQGWYSRVLGANRSSILNVAMHKECWWAVARPALSPARSGTKRASVISEHRHLFHTLRTCEMEPEHTLQCSVSGLTFVGPTIHRPGQRAAFGGKR
jgi:hypothetical protein